MKTMIGIGARMFNCALILSVASGCAMESAEAGDEEAVGVQQQALTVQDYFASGAKVQIRVKTCDWSAVGAHPVGFCPVDAGYVLVGGGAEVEGSASGGGLLTFSTPANTSTWIAGSKDHVSGHSHRIRAYSVGMKLSGMTETTLRSLVTITRATSASSNRPSATAAVPGGHVMLSGGAMVNYNGSGVLLTESYPSGGGFSWTASAKDHNQADTGTITTSVISVPVCLNNLWPNGSCLVTNTQSSSAASGGYTVATVNTPVGFAPLGVGGRARWSGSGRLLTDIFPTNSVGNAGATAWSKDHISPENNTTDVWGISVQAWP